MSRGRVSIAILFLKQAANACENIARWDKVNSEKDNLLALTKQMRETAARLEDL